MKITFIGTSHGIMEKDRYCACTVVTVNGKHYVIDAGAPVADLFIRNGFNYEDIAGIFITHTHEDHMMGLTTLTQTIIEFPNHFSNVSFPVYVPDLKRYRDMFSFINGYPEFTGPVTYNKYKAGVIFDDGVVKVKSIPTKHFENSHAFILEAEGKKIGFSGDLHYDLIDYPVDFVSSEKQFDLVVMEAAHQGYNENYVYDVLSKTNTKKMVINHIYEVKNPLNVLAEFGKKISDKFEFSVSYDGLVIDL